MLSPKKYILCVIAAAGITLETDNYNTSNTMTKYNYSKCFIQYKWSNAFWKYHFEILVHVLLKSIFCLKRGFAAALRVLQKLKVLFN